MGSDMARPWRRSHSIDALRWLEALIFCPTALAWANLLASIFDVACPPCLCRVICFLSLRECLAKGLVD